MFFNTQQPATMGALSNLFTGTANTPEQVDYALTGQQRDYIRSQGDRLGIGDPALFFAKQQQQAQLAATPSGGAIEAARQMGQLPGQVAESQRQSMWDQVAASKAAETSQLASLQMAQADRRHPLVPGQDPVLTPLEQQEATRLGQTPLQFVTNQRLGSDRGLVNPVAGVRSPDPEELYQHPNFQALMQSRPDKAGEIFTALTGHGDFPGFVKGQLARQQKETDFGVSTLREALASGKATVGQDGSIKWRQMVPDPLNPGKLTLGADYTAGDAFQQSLSKYLPHVSADIARFKALAAKQGPTPAPVASLQNPSPEPSTFGQTAANFVSGSANTLARAFTGRLGEMDPNGAYGPAPVATQTQLPAWVRGPEFQKLLKTKPDSARRILAGLQQGGMGAPAEAGGFGGY